MKTIVLAILAGVTLGSAHALAATEAEAAAAFAKRDYTAATVEQVRTAARIYGELAAVAGGPLEKARLLAAKSRALNVIGDSAKSSGDDKRDREERKAQYLEAADAAGEGLQLVGISDVTKASSAQLRTLPDAQRSLMAEVLLWRAQALHNWATTDQPGFGGITVSWVAKWFEIRGALLLIRRIGKQAHRNYAADRLLGIGLGKTPRLLGGDSWKGYLHAMNAMQMTLVKNKVYSRDGAINLAFADALVEREEEGKALAILRAFVAAPVEEFDPADLPEVRRFKAEAARWINDF